MTEDQKTDWSKIAAWTFGIWAAMVPLSASIIGYYQRETIGRQDAIRAEIAALRLEVVQSVGALRAETTETRAIQRDVLRRVQRLEDQDELHHRERRDQ